MTTRIERRRKHIVGSQKYSFKSTFREVGLEKIHTL